KHNPLRGRLTRNLIYSTKPAVTEISIAICLQILGIAKPLTMPGNLQRVFLFFINNYVAMR
ncbi:hypothetical protein NK034_16790, partial [Klebsiella pneumoniae]|nr:hypothetical protein [Klebsiella pneumoniae]